MPPISTDHQFKAKTDTKLAAANLMQTVPKIRTFTKVDSGSLTLESKNPYKGNFQFTAHSADSNEKVKVTGSFSQKYATYYK